MIGGFPPGLAIDPVPCCPDLANHRNPVTTCLPLPDVDDALAELAYALHDLRLDGVVLFSNARGVYLGDTRLIRCSRSCSAGRPWFSRIPTPRPTPAPTRSDCPTRSRRIRN